MQKDLSHSYGFWLLAEIRQKLILFLLLSYHLIRHLNPFIFIREVLLLNYHRVHLLLLFPFLNPFTIFSALGNKFIFTFLLLDSVFGSLNLGFDVLLSLFLTKCCGSATLDYVKMIMVLMAVVVCATIIMGMLFLIILYRISSRFKRRCHLSHFLRNLHLDWVKLYLNVVEDYLICHKLLVESLKLSLKCFNLFLYGFVVYTKFIYQKLHPITFLRSFFLK